MDSSVSRRGVLSGALVAIGAGVVGYAVANNSSYAKAKSATAAANGPGYGAPAKKQRLAALSSVPAGGGVILSRQDVVLTRDAAGTVHAFSATCTHQGCQVTQVKNGHILCPCHGSAFDASTGKPTSGPAPRALPTVNVTVEGDSIYAG